MSYEERRIAVETFQRDHQATERIVYALDGSETYWCGECGALLELGAAADKKKPGYVYRVPNQSSGCES